jgi:hypothetical protein
MGARDGHRGMLGHLLGVIAHDFSPKKHLSVLDCDSDCAEPHAVMRSQRRIHRRTKVSIGRGSGGMPLAGDINCHP